MAEHDRTMGDVSGGEGSESESKVKETAHHAQEKASELAASVREKTGHLKEEGKHLAEEGKERAQELAHRAGDKARSRADEERTRLTGGLRSVATALRRGTDELPEDRQMYGRMVNTLADRADDLSRYLEEHDVDEMTWQARRFARDHTGVVVGSAFALGVLGARFLKSSGQSQSRQYGDMNDTRYDNWNAGGGYEATAGGTSRGYERPGGYARGEVYHAGSRGDLGTEDRLEHGGDGLGGTDLDLDEGRGTDGTGGLGGANA